MIKRYALMIAAAALVSSSVGCCLTGCGYRGSCPPCGAGYAPASMSPCGPGGCQPSYAPQGAYYQGASATAMGDSAIMTASPIIPGSVYPSTASIPINTVPVY
ncbi:MAG TPA: hypothetical protein VFG20_18090 [Planctomycetaceae bacterium]|nr:hypothetical protein [Planctomycetaceae bacterium]